MQKTIITVSITVLLTTLILVSGFVFMQNNQGLNKEINIPKSVGEIVEKQENKIVSDQDVVKEENKENERIKKGDKKVSIVVKGDMNYVVYTDEKGEEFIIDKALMRTIAKPDRRNFQEVRFSSKENYIIYSFQGHDLSSVGLYDIKSKQIISKDSEDVSMESVQKKEFTPDEKYLFSCGRGYVGNSNAYVYLMPERKKVFDVFGRFCDGGGEGCENKYGTEFYNDHTISSCNYDEKNNKIEFILINKNDKGDTKTIGFDLK